MTRPAFHPLIQHWLDTTFVRPTAVQQAAWSEIPGGGHVLVAAPTGTGKTLAGWLPLIDRLLRTPASGRGVRVIYVSPLRALSRDMVSQLMRPLAVLEEADGGGPAPTIGLRTSDTPAGERRAQQRRPPEMLVTTPESLFVLLCSAAGRRMLRTVEAVMVDEIHALADNKRGAHLALSLEFLDHIRAGSPAQRIGLSATQRPLARMGEFLAGGRACALLEPMPDRVPRLRIELPARPLGAFADGTHSAEIHQRLAEIAATRRSMLVFCNTRAQVERTARALSELLGEDQVAAHHGSLGQDRRREVEAGLRHGRLRVVVSSASLELGLDLGRVEEVCLLGSPGRINVLRQRAGRACHRPDAVPRACLFPRTLSDLLEARALCAALAAGEMDTSQVMEGADDVLSQQLVAMTAAGIDRLDTLFSLVRRAWPWRDLAAADFERVVAMLADGFVPGRETGRGLLIRSGGRLIPAPGAARRVRMNAGTIPVWFDYPVVREPDRRVLGSLDEEYAFESSPGQIMQLGNQVLRILRVSPGQVSVESAPGETPDVPFWFGDAPGRSDALSRYVQAIAAAPPGEEPDPQLLSFLHDSARVLGRMPGPDCIVLERFFDAGGDQHVVIHTLRGARINRAWGLALRKRFCRQFNFELQAAATENAILISLGATHSFELAELLGYLKTASVRQVLIQAVLDTPLYLTRFRWCANTALAIQRVGPRGKVPAQLQRNQTENLVARVFPDQLACLENLRGERRVPDHPLVTQALRDCLDTHMDIAGLETLLQAMETGRIAAHCVETAEPSPLALAVIRAPRHTHLDPAAAEERRTRAFESQPLAPRAPAAPAVHGGVPAERVRQARKHAWISASDSHAFEIALIRAGYLTAHEGESGVSSSGARAAGGWVLPFRHLMRQGLAGRVRSDARRCFWVAAERLPEMRAIWPEAAVYPASLGRSVAAVAPEEALQRLLLARVRVLGPVPDAWLARETGLPPARIATALAALRAEGVLMCSQGSDGTLWWARECRLVAA